jgi:uncharacterized protein YjbI with pentapeptide repeats
VQFHDTNLRHSTWQDAFWCGIATESDFTFADIYGLEVSTAKLIQAILPNGTTSDDIWENILIDHDFLEARVNSIESTKPE